MNSLLIKDEDFHWIEEEINEAYSFLSEKEKKLFNEKHLKLPILYPLHESLITEDDNSIFVVFIDGIQVIVFNDIEELFSVGVIENSSIKYSGAYTTLSECIENIKSSKEKDTYFLIELSIIFLQQQVNLYAMLYSYLKKLNKSNIINQGTEHDSTHYIENIYFKWKKGNVKIKLYIDDYRDNTLCFDISSNNEDECNEVSKKLVKLLKSETIEIKVTKSWEN